MDLTVRPLLVEDAHALSSLLLAQPPEYARFFYAFGFAEEEIAKIITERGEDVYSGIFWQGQLVGMFMLRGWEAGYEVPAIGVFIGETYSGRGYWRLAVELSKVICKMRGASRLMAKAHPDNISVKSVEKLGFVRTGVDSDTGNLIYHLDL